MSATGCHPSARGADEQLLNPTIKGCANKNIISFSNLFIWLMRYNLEYLLLCFFIQNTVIDYSASAGKITQIFGKYNYLRHFFSYLLFAKVGGKI